MLSKQPIFTHCKTVDKIVNVKYILQVFKREQNIRLRL